MQTIRILLLVAFIAIGFAGRAQNEQTIREYIQTYRELAIEEMQRTGVPAAIKLAQGIHETTAGTSELVRKSNNHFGIKCKSNWTGPSVSHDDDARGECFRKYEQAEQSYRDHSDFLKNSPRYASLFTLDPLDYSAWAYGLKKAGYATNPKYPQIIVRIIEEYQLNDYSLIAMGKLERKDDEVFASVTTQEQPKQAIIPAVVVTPTASETVSGPQSQSPVVAEPVAEEAKPSYPSGEFTINETRVIYAREGTSYLSIAQQYNIPLARIFEFNELKTAEATEKDQLIFLQRKRKTGAHEIHVVERGETLTSIAQKEGIRLDSLLEYNALNGRSRPAPGEKLFLSKK